MWSEGLFVTHDELENPPLPGFQSLVTPEISHGSENGPWMTVGDTQAIVIDSPRPFYIQVKPDQLRIQGQMYLRLRVTLWNSTEPDLSAAVGFITDTVAPYKGYVPLPLQVTPEEITDAVLSGPGVKATVPDYVDFAPGDHIQVFWVSAEGEITGDPILNQALAGNGAVLTLDAAAIRANGSGQRWLAYVLVDKANNISRLSVLTPLKVALGELANGMQPPVIPLAQDVGVLDLADARQGVFVHIKPFEHVLPGDTLDLWWGSTKLSQVPTWPFPGSDLLVSVSPAILQREYGDATGELPLDVAYEVRRAGVLMGTRQTTPILVDFYIGGPQDPDPEWPDPVNENLTAPILVPPVSSNPNRLEPEDFGKDATVRVNVHADVDVGQILRFYWNDVYLSDIDHEVVTGEPGSDITESVKWAFIAATGNGVQQLSYRVYPSSSNNYWESLPQAVDVAAVPMPELLFPDVNDLGFLACEALQDASTGGGKIVRVQVPDLSVYLTIGETLTLHWEPWREFQGEDPSLRLDSFIFNEDVVLGSDRSPGGFMWEVPYDPNVKCIYDAGDSDKKRYGRGRVSYSYSKNGSTTASDVAEALVAMFMSNDPCRI
jgi:hypothetical protein